MAGCAALHPPYDSPRALGMHRYLVLLLLCLAGSAGGAAGAAEPPGRYEGVHGGARYIIDVPPQWNGGLVMFAHGYEGEGEGVGTARDSPMAQHLVRRGYASAASGYRAWGYRPDWFLLDLLALKAHFINRFGPPRWTVVHGQSMGGMSRSARWNCTPMHTRAH